MEHIRIRSTCFNAIVLIVLVYLRHQCAATSSTTTEVCYGKAINASCTSGTVLMIDNAVYGRMQSGGKCRISEGHAGCSADVTSYVERHCAGRRRCDMPVSDGIRLWASDNMGCPSDHLGYLRVTYHCLPVYEGDGKQCDRNPLTVASSSTYLANVVTVESRRGSRSCPWLIRVSHGQTVNLTLFDFAVQEVKPTTRDFSGDQFPSCQIYARMYIGTAAEPTVVCRGSLRQRVLHTRTGRQDIRIAISSSQQHFYLLHVDVRQTYGCAAYEPTEDQNVMSESNETVLLRCVRGSNTARTWMLSCVNGQWTTDDDQGVECTPNNQLIPSAGSGSDPPTGLSNQAILITLAVTLTITLIIIAVGVIVYLRSKWRRRGANADGIDPYVYGSATFGLHTLPHGINGVDCCDAASVGGCSQARSQRDLYHPGTAQWTPRSRHCPPGTYATTLEMRRVGSTPGSSVGYSNLQHAGGSQLTLPGVWATPCPVHGAAGTYGRHYPVHHIYNMPLIDTENDGAMVSTAGDSNPMSPFYHELDGLVLGLNEGPTPPPRPDDNDPNSAPFSKI